MLKNRYTNNFDDEKLLDIIGKWRKIKGFEKIKKILKKF